MSMTIKPLIIFSLALSIFYALLSAGSNWFVSSQKKIILRQSNLIQATVIERFKKFINVPLSIGMATADYFSNGSLETKAYGAHVQDMLKINAEILGLNIVNNKGVIIRVHPPELNPDTVGRVSQNFMLLVDKFHKGENYWFSSPFKLYQGRPGFVIYVPILENKKLKGWFAPVISSELFFEQFKLSEFLSSFDLIIKDKETQLNYYATAMLPDSDFMSYEAQIWGRPLTFLIWPKKNPLLFSIPWWVILLTSGLMSGLLIYVMNLYSHRKKDRRQMQDISMLLKLTTKDALNILVEENLSMETRNDYITNLLEQINLLQSMATTGEGPDQSEVILGPLIHEQIELLDELKSKRELNIQFKAADFSEAKVFTNQWLLQNCIFGNILVHLILFAQQNSSIYITLKSTTDEHILTFHSTKAARPGGQDPFVIDRRLEVTKKVLALYKGEFFLQHDLAEGIMVRITLPKA